MGNKCSRCKSICSFVKTNCMEGTGPENPDLMFLGEAPGEDEDRIGSPFVGMAGRFLHKNILRPLNIDPSTVRISNGVRCRPTKENKKTKTRSNRTPDRKEIMNCRSYLEEEIKRIKPKVLILLGNVPLCSVVFLDKVQGITRWRGRSMWSSEFNCWIISTYHPSALMRDRNMGLWFRYNQAIEDIKKALEMVNWKVPNNKELVPEARLLKTEISIRDYLRKVIKNKLVAVDTETDLLDPRGDILGVSLCYKEDSKYYPVYFEWKMIEESTALSSLLDRVLTGSDITKVFQNRDYDSRFFYQHGFKVRGTVHDTMEMAHLLDENFSVGLKERTWIDLTFGGYDIPLEKWKIEHKWVRNRSYKDIPIDVIAPYAALDAAATLMLCGKYIPRMIEEELWPLYSKISMPVREVMTEASINGMYLNMEVAEALDKRMTKAMKFLEEKIYEVVGEKFKFTSTKQLATKLFEEMKAPHGGKTKKGNWKCDKAVLVSLAQRDVNRRYVKLAQFVLKYKYIDKLRGTYIGQAREYLWEDGKIHSSYNQTGTVTGRASNSKPCTHNIPKDRLIRSLYRASPGNKLVEADSRQSEMRCIAAESHDELLIKIIESGKDIHNMTYNEMFGKDPDYVPTQDERRIAKSINFGLIYGITAIGLARRLGVDIDTAQSYIDRYFKRFCGVAKWMADIIVFARKHGYVVSLFKRRRRLLDILNDDKYERWRAQRQAMNSPIQGESADFTYIVAVRVYKMLKKYNLKAKIVHSVHDCILVDTPPSEVNLVKRIIKWAFTKPIAALPMKMDCDIEVNEMWGEHNESNLEVILTECAA